MTHLFDVYGKEYRDFVQIERGLARLPLGAQYIVCGTV